MAILLSWFMVRVRRCARYKHQLSCSLKRERVFKLQGILIEENKNYGLITTTNYLSVRVPSQKGKKKQRVKVRITRILNENLCEGTIVKTA